MELQVMGELMASTSEESISPGNEADTIIEQAEAIRVSTQDFTRILDLLEHPPLPNDKLKAAIEALPETL